MEVKRSSHVVTLITLFSTLLLLRRRFFQAFLLSSSIGRLLDVKAVAVIARFSMFCKRNFEKHVLETFFKTLNDFGDNFLMLKDIGEFSNHFGEIFLPRKSLTIDKIHVQS